MNESTRASSEHTSPYKSAGRTRHAISSWLALAAVLVSWSGAAARAGEPAEEQRLIGILQSGATAREKDAACAQLKRVGTAAAVPALARLLTDGQLSHSARYALESLPGPEAGQVLLNALETTTGLTQAGIADSLGKRGEARAVPALARLLAQPDANVARAAAGALGQIGGSQAIEALEEAVAGVSGSAQRTAYDALLTAAEGELAAGRREQASAIFERLHQTSAPDHVRAAAFRGQIAASGKQALPLVKSALQGADAAEQGIALQMASGIDAPGAVKILGGLLTGLAPAAQAALIEALRQRGDPAAAIAIAPLCKSPSACARLAAIKALGELGDATVVGILAEAAASADEAEKKAGRQALLDLNRGEVAAALVAQLGSAEPEVQAEVGRALAGRAESAAVPSLLRIAREGPADSRQAACRALGRLADAPHVGPLVDLILDSQTEARRSAARDALVEVCRRVQSQGVRVDARPIVEGLSRGDLEGRAALLQAAATVADPRVRAALRQCAANPELHEAAVRAMGQTCDPELAPDLLEAAGHDAPTLRVLAFRGYVRLVTGKENAKTTPAQRAAAIKRILPLAPGVDEKRLALSGLATVAAPEALQLAMGMLHDMAAAAEAAQAVLQIALSLISTHPDLARAAVKDVLAGASDPDLRAAAEAARKQIEGSMGFITTWQVAGPYEQSGKGATELFDTVFPPEASGATEVKWRPLPAGGDSARLCVMDLLAALGGTQRAGYARTRIFSPAAQSAQLELGSDDGIKAWLNGQLVCANNYVGPLVVGSQRAAVALRQGWNTLALKITQNIMGWEFCARLAAADGTPLEGLRFDAAFAGAPEGLQLQPTPTPIAAPESPTPVRFRRAQLDAAFRSEGVAVADFNRDGNLDIATGNLLYLGPDWKARPMLAAPKEYKPEGYSDEFYCFAEDLSHDGWTDLIVVGFPGQRTRWLENPGATGGSWKEHPAIENTGNESPEWIDADNDGRKELVFVSSQGMAFAQPGADPAQPWPIRVIAGPKDPRPGHGLGVGDINGDGRADVVCPVGWWEAPGDGPLFSADRAGAPWAFHKAVLGDAAPAQMCVCDVDGDGDADVLSSSAHHYGLWWHEQTPQGWTPHEIDATISQLHALHLADINGDGLPDIVTGKRFWAHTHNDSGINDPAVLCWFELRRKNGRPEWLRHTIDTDSGVGLQVQIIDLNGDGLLDIATSNKKGVYAFTQERERRTKGLT